MRARAIFEQNNKTAHIALLVTYSMNEFWLPLLLIAFGFLSPSLADTYVGPPSVSNLVAFAFPRPLVDIPRSGVSCVTVYDALGYATVLFAGGRIDSMGRATNQVDMFSMRCASI